VSTNTPKIVDFGFSPFIVHVPPGTTVTWTNTGDQPHSATSDTQVWDSDILQKGQSFSFKFDQPGSYDYFCKPHPFMRGKVVVDAEAPAPVQAQGQAPAGQAPAGQPPTGQPPVGQAPVSLPRTGESSSPWIVLLLAASLIGLGTGVLIGRMRGRRR
jgi:amicyanin